MIYLIDNYDSFSYNLYQLVGSVNPDIAVVRNDAIDVGEFEEIQPEAIILSPGPGKPADAGICEAVVREYSGRIPILGVCLGHQAIVEALGGKVGHAIRLMHGKADEIELVYEDGIFKGMESPLLVGRYHSLSAVQEQLPDCLRVSAIAPDGEIMAVEHMSHPTFGLQFHPESIMTPGGKKIIENFLSYVRK